MRNPFWHRARSGHRGPVILPMTISRTCLCLIAALATLTAHADEPAAKISAVPPLPGTPLPAATPAAIQAAITRGVDFLTSTQNSNGSWGGPTLTKDLNIYAPLPGAHHAFRAGSTGLALSGIIDSRDLRPETQAAIQKAGAWAALELPKLRRADTTSTYNVWGHAYSLRALVRLYQRETDIEKKAEWKRLAAEQISLADRYQDVYGGWGYLDGFDGLATQKPSGMPTSFTTATLLLAMASARDVMDLKLDEKNVKASLESIRRQRTPDFSYTYSHQHRYRPRSPINRPAGSLARSQSCNAALRVFGDETVTDAVIDTWAERFLNREGWLSIGRKRPVPHETHFLISGYFYYYGIYYFTESVALLPREKQAPYAKRLASILLERQEKDGSWWDYPLYSYHQPYGTGYSLMALSWCRDVIAQAQ